MKTWKVRFYDIDQRAVISIVVADTYGEAVECVRETHELGEGNPFTNIVEIESTGTLGTIPHEIYFHYEDCEE